MVEIFLSFLIFGALGVLLVIMNKILGPRSLNPIKETPFECGSPYLQDEINPVSIKFVTVAFLFLLFDIEVVFFFPWAIVFKKLGLKGLLIMGSYLLVLIFGFIYAWKKGAFEWEK